MTFKYVGMVIFLLSCKTVSTQTEQLEFEEIAAQRLGTEVYCEMNENETMVLCIESANKKRTAGNNGVNFVVLDMKNNDLLYQGSQAQAVRWLDKYQIEVQSIPETINISDIGNEYHFIYDLKNRRKKPVGVKQP